MNFMNNTILQVKKEDCYGCGACSNKCPVSAISMEYDEDGFLFPEIDETRCINCGQCLNACPVVNFKKRNHTEPECYAVWANQDLRMKSSSGGMFSLLADYILKQNGYVCGASFTDDYQYVEHIIISDSSELDKLRRSKYVQSNTGQTYKIIQELLKNGKKVLFSGCPCQVAGLYTFLEKKYDNLYTVDVVCHGGNSVKAYHAFLKERAKGRNIKSINFREKEVYGWGTPSVIHFENGDIFREGASTCTWYKGFLNGIINRKVCGKCPFATQIRQSDITLADFWGIEKYKPELNDNRGTSMVLLNNVQGQELFECVKINMTLCEKVPYEFGWKRNGQLYKAQKSHIHRDLFFQVLDKYGYDKAIECVVDYKLDVGIMGWWYNANYGGVATYYALHQLLRSKGYSVLMIDNPIKGGTPFYSQGDTMPYRFALKHYNCSKRYTAYDLRALNAHCSTFIVGSDQMWNYWLRDITGKAFYLEFATSDKKKIAYGASFGNRYTVPEVWRSQTAYYVQQFDYVSVREDYAVDMAREFYDIEAKHVIDPVFLCEKEEYYKIIAESKCIVNEAYICCYILNPTEEKRKIIQFVSEKLNMPVKIILDASVGAFEENKRKMGLDGVIDNVEEEDWMYYIKNSSYVISDSFHGVCFSIIFEKAFLCLANPERGIQRFTSLLGMLNIKNRLVSSLKEVQANTWLLDEIEYTPINEIINRKKEDSLKWLMEALTAQKPRLTSTYDVISRENQELKNQIFNIQSELNILKSSLKTESVTSPKENKLSFLSRKIRNGILCCKDHGIVYTIQLFWQKICHLK